ncbi:hypothetical protein ACH4UT_31690 [Streptomyces sp. NPDC020799]|uniref:hypothetical protein n=1 Tax=Streptomyces sp. NPDC020799 TaxID=3365091 RepID=UPI00347BF799
MTAPPVKRPSTTTAGTGQAGSRHHAPGTPTTIIIDPDDDPDVTAAALNAHSPTGGRITVHPTPGASHPPGLAQDVLTALGKRLPGHDPHVPRHHSSWADMVQPAWTAAASWINAHRVGHLIVLRAHTLTPTRWEHLGTLRARTGIRLTLVWHAKPDAHLQARTAKLGTAHQEIHDLDTVRARFHQKGPVRPGPPRNAGESPRDSSSTELRQTRDIQQVGHPLHAGLLAAQTLAPDATAAQLAAVRLADLAPDATALALPHPPYRPTSTPRWHRAPAWTQPLLTAARAWHYLSGHPHDSHHLFQHTNFHHHNQLTGIAAALGIHAAIEQLTGDPAWPTPPDTH